MTKLIVVSIVSFLIGVAASSVVIRGQIKEIRNNQDLVASNVFENKNAARFIRDGNYDLARKLLEEAMFSTLSIVCQNMPEHPGKSAFAWEVKDYIASGNIIAEIPPNINEIISDLPDSAADLKYDRLFWSN